jgi:hypothetical protein
MTDHESMADWDGAYVLGALSTADRRAYESHLESCERCRRAVADLAPLPGLLGRIDDATGMALLDPSADDEGPAPDLLDRVRAEDVVRRRRRRRTRAIVGLAAAAAILAAVVLPLTLVRPAPPSRTVALDAEAGVPLTASVTMIQRGWGTQLDVDCAYGHSGGSDWSYELAVVGKDGTESTVSSWTALAGKEITLTGATSIPYGSIRSIEIRSLPDGATVMHSDVDG